MQLKPWHINKNVQDVRWKSDERSVYHRQQRSPEPGGSQPSICQRHVEILSSAGRGAEDPLS